MEKPELLRRLEEQKSDLQLAQDENAILRAQIRGYEVISDKYHTDTRKYRKEKQVWIDTEQRYIEETKVLTTQVKEKELQIRVAIHALKVNEKQLEDQTKDQAQKETQYTQTIESLNQLLKDTEETTQRQVEGLKADILKRQQGKLDAEYITAEVREELQVTKEELKLSCANKWGNMRMS